MNKITLFELLNTFDRKEIRDFKKFLHSPLFNQRKDVIILYDLFLESTSFSEGFWTKERIWQKINPGHPFKAAQLHHVQSYLHQLAQDFLAQQEFWHTSFQRNIHLGKALRRKKMSTHFEKNWNKNKAQLQKASLRHTDYHYQKYQLSRELYAYEHHQQRSGESNLQQLTEELTTFYAAELLKQSCSILSHQQMSQQNYAVTFLPEVLEKVEKNNWLEEPAIAIYYHSYRALSDLSQETHFEQLKMLIDQHWTKFPASEIRDIFLLAINYCIQRLNAGDRQFIREAFELYRSGLSKSVLLENAQLSHFTYKNVLKLGMELREFDWVEAFLYKYKTALPPENRENIFLHTLAVFYFGKPDYDRVLELLRQVEFKDKLHELDARRMLLRIYMEREAFDALESLLDSFQVYIRRQPELGYHRENYLNLIRYTRKLLRIPAHDREGRLSLAQEIESVKAIAERRWLMEKLQAQV